MEFSELKLDKHLMRGIKDAGFSHCMPVQEKTLSQTLNGRDVLVQSQTGTGKTAAFLITIFQLFIKDRNLKKKKALVIVPTRELAVQIEKEAKLLGVHLKFTIGSFYGGVGYKKQEKMLLDGVNIIIGTPGRLLDLNRSGKLHLKDIEILIIDEADRLFDMGFLPDIKKMIKGMPPLSKRRTMLFSATLNSRVRDLGWQYMNNPADIVINPEQVTVKNVTQVLYHVGADEKKNLLLGILKREKPKNALIFTNMKSTAVEIAKRLKHNGYNCQYIIGDLPQKKRLRIIENLKSGKIQYLVASDVASRGLHIDDLELVINYDLPEDSESYVHRIGRTARVGKQGKAISLVCEKFVYYLEAIESLIETKIPVLWADEELFEEDRYTDMQSNRKKHAGRRKSAKKSPQKKKSN